MLFFSFKRTQSHIVNLVRRLYHEKSVLVCLSIENPAHGDSLCVSIMCIRAPFVFIVLGCGVCIRVTHFHRLVSLKIQCTIVYGRVVSPDNIN